jgi:DegV family protein with EDD domain
MKPIAIVTDSTADLAADVAARAGIVVVPVLIAPTADSTRESAPSGAGAEASDRPSPPVPLVAAFGDVFRRLAEQHDAIVAVLLSAKLGNAHAAAEEARQRVSSAIPVEIVDSRSASMGLGFQALRAAALARQGHDAGAIAAELRAATDRYHVVFSVESVEHLRQRGRIGRSAAMIAEALQLKPLLRIDEGQIVPFERARTRARAIAELAGFVRDLPAIERVAALYATQAAAANEVARLVAAECDLGAGQIEVVPIGPTVASQVGPGAFGLAVVEAESR